jgi:DNA-binding transcriptional ArsR family regulator
VPGTTSRRDIGSLLDHDERAAERHGLAMTGAEPEQAVFAALADPTRRALLRSIATGEANTPTELAARLPVSRQAVRKHLALLEQARLVDAERSGREIHFQATPAPLGDAIAWMTAVGARWDDRLAALGRAVAAGRGDRGRSGGSSTSQR